MFSSNCSGVYFVRPTNWMYLSADLLKMSFLKLFQSLFQFQIVCVCCVCVYVIVIIIRQPVYNWRLYSSGNSGNLFFCLSGSLMYLNEATLLNNIRVRYSKDKIYVSTDSRKWHTLQMLNTWFIFLYFLHNIIIFSGTWTANRSQAQTSFVPIRMTVASKLQDVWKIFL